MKAVTIPLLLGLLATNATAQSIRALYPSGVEGGLSIRGVSRNREDVTIAGDSGSSAFLWNSGAIQSVGAQITGLSSDGAVIAGYIPAQETTVEGGPVTHASDTAFIQTVSSAAVSIPPPAGYDYVVSHDLSGNGNFLLVTAYGISPLSWTICVGLQRRAMKLSVGSPTRFLPTVFAPMSTPFRKSAQSSSD